LEALNGLLRRPGVAHRLHDAGFAPPAECFDAEELAEIREGGPERVCPVG
jgi:acetyl-CoA acetyltransferase